MIGYVANEATGNALIFIGCCGIAVGVAALVFSALNRWAPPKHDEGREPPPVESKNDPARANLLTGKHPRQRGGEHGLEEPDHYGADHLWPERELRRVGWLIEGELHPSSTLIGDQWLKSLGASPVYCWYSGDRALTLFDQDVA